MATKNGKTGNGNGSGEVLDIFGIAAATATTGKSSKAQDKRTVSLTDPRVTEAMKTLHECHVLGDEIEAKAKDARTTLLQFTNEAFLSAPNSDSFIVVDDKGGNVMVAPVDKATKVKDDDRMNYLNGLFPNLVCKTFEFKFDEEMLEKHGKKLMAAVSEAISKLDIPTEDKVRVFKATPIFSVRKGLPDFIRGLDANKKKIAIAEIGMQFQVKNPQYKSVDVATFDEYKEAYEKQNKKA